MDLEPERSDNSTENDRLHETRGEGFHEPPLASQETTAPFGYQPRYICFPTPLKEGTCFSVGICDPFEGTTTPIWLRFNKRYNNTPGMFRQILARLAASELSSRMVQHMGHLWIPLDLPVNETDGELLVRSLVEKIEKIVAIAYTEVLRPSS